VGVDVDVAIHRATSHRTRVDHFFVGQTGRDRRNGLLMDAAGAKKNVVVLGATGSIGDSTFRVLENLGSEYRVLAMSGGEQLDRLALLAKEWEPQYLCVGRSESVGELAGAAENVLSGESGLDVLATLPEADLVVNGLVGAIGLRPTLAALQAGKKVAMANKEPIVMAGGLLLEAAQRGGGEIIPLDSEPNAIWQCLKGEHKADLERVILTASGGPFFARSRSEMENVTPAEALNHPTWKMGAKITVDSATLMNKGFEVIEATWLFDLPIDRIDVVIHRQSVVHSLVEFVDGALLAHLGKTNMQLPIQYALTHPRRSQAPLGRFNLAEVGQLTFSEPDGVNFPCLDLCYSAGEMGGTAPAALNAANEVAVAAFLDGKIGFLDISALNSDLLAAHQVRRVSDIETVFQVDAEARMAANRWIERRA